MAQGLGIYIVKSDVRWAVAEYKEGTVTVSDRGAFSLDNEGTVSFPDNVPDDITVCFTSEKGYFYPLTFPFKSDRKILSVLKNDIEEKSLDPIETVIADFYTVEGDEQGRKGFGVTYPREWVFAGIEATGKDREPRIITLDIFVLADLLNKVSEVPESYYMVAFTGKTAFIGAVEKGIFKSFRSIPVRVGAPEDACRAVDELVKRFKIQDPENEIYVFCGPDDVDAMLRNNDAFPYQMVDIKMEAPDRSDINAYLVPAAAAVAAVSHGVYPNFRRDDFKYPGVFSGLITHSVVFLSILALFFAVIIVMLIRMKGGYVQEVRSLEARSRQDAEKVIGEVRLQKGSKTQKGKEGQTKPAKQYKDYKDMSLVELEEFVRSVNKKSTPQSGKGDGSKLPTSAFKILHEILNYMPEGLDVTWERIMIKETLIYLNGKLAEEDSDKYDQQSCIQDQHPPEIKTEEEIRAGGLQENIYDS
jgi:hypothetical protein